MGEKTGISWTNKTWNPWKGCKMVSPGCKNCYMFRDMRRYGMDPEDITRTKPGTFNAPIKWNREAQANRKPEFVFTASWSDWFIVDADDWRDEAWKIVKDTPWLIYQVLTKRADRILDHLPADWGEGYPNVGIGVSVESSPYLSRVDLLRQVPAKVRFISAEPLIGSLAGIDLTGIHWLISGGESEPDDSKRREMDLEWARELRDACAAQNCTYFHKQGSGPKPGMYPALDGRLHQDYPEWWITYRPEHEIPDGGTTEETDSATPSSVA